MFYCETHFYCDICGKGFKTSGKRMADCSSKAQFRFIQKKEGWRTVYGKYDVCKDCMQHYGTKEIRRMLKNRMEEK